MAAAHQTPIELVLHHRISPERLAPYIRETPTLHEAIRLYRWNIDLSGAVYEDLHVFEVVLRNAIDEQLCNWNATQPEPESGQLHSSDWLLDPSALLLRSAGRDMPDVAHSNPPHAGHRANVNPYTKTSLPQCPSEPRHRLHRPAATLVVHKHRAHQRRPHCAIFPCITRAEGATR